MLSIPIANNSGVANWEIQMSVIHGVHLDVCRREQGDLQRSVSDAKEGSVGDRDSSRSDLPPSPPTGTPGPEGWGKYERPKG